MRGPSPGATPRIGVLADDVSNGYSEPILSELSDAAREHGVGLVSFVERLDPEIIQSRQRRLATDLAGPNTVDGLLVLPIGYDLNAAEVAAYCERFGRIPICSVPEIAGEGYSRVSVDNEAGMRQAMVHLIEVHGFRRIAVVRGPKLSEEAELRYRVYRDVLEAYGIAFDPTLEAPGNYVTQDGADAVRMLLDERKLELDAIVCANDGTAFGVLEALTARNLQVPRDLAVIGFDDVDTARHVDPPLTTVRQPLRELGRAALEILLRQVREGGPPERVVLPSELVIRESCGCQAYDRDGGAGDSLVPSPGLPALETGVAELSDAMLALGISGAPATHWPESLIAAFVRDVAGRDSVFLGELRALLNSLIRVRGDVGDVHKVLTLLWQRARTHLRAGSIEWRRADVLLHAGRAAVSSAAERLRSNRQVRHEDFTFKLTRTGNALGAAVDLSSVGRILEADLPGYGISACYLCVYDRHVDGRPANRLLSAFDEHGPLSLPEAGLVFDADRLLPETLSLPAAHQFVVGPLTRAGAALGYAVFARGPSEGFVYENLMSQIGAAIQRVELLRRLVREAELREDAERRRMQSELTIASRIQAGVLPRAVDVPGLEISAAMRPASEVGGDYYDVIPTPAGCWFGIGDVAGHGLPTGLVMLMLQSAVSSLLRQTRARRRARSCAPSTRCSTTTSAGAWARTSTSRSPCFATSTPAGSPSRAHTKIS